MTSLYLFVRGPLVWVAFIVFIVGSIYKICGLISVAKKDKVVLSYFSLKYSLRSILHWLVPFGSRNWRRQPVLTIVTFAFHICLISIPIFLLAHNILWYESWGISWWTLPEGTADVMTLIVIAGCVYFLCRRLFSPQVKYLTFASDYVLLAVVALPFITGFIVYHQWVPSFMVIVHMLTGEIALMVLPFTRLFHMVFFWFTRAYTGSEFGLVRHVKDY
ncbi:MAG TPA: nitrate reductase [Desulfotomaculum sp.]|nr:nitrate reductase [Desulfotomaculum sp.]